MRQNLHTLFLCLTLAFASACVQVIPESGETPEPHKGNLTLTVGMEAARSTLDGLTPRWVEGDALSAINASGNYKLWLIDAENGVFSGDVEGDYPFLITYPYNEDYTAGSYAAGTATLSIPATQTLAHGQNVAPGALVAAGVLSPEETTVTLKNLVSLVKLTVNRGDLNSISFSSTKEGEPLCGSVSLNPADPGEGITVTSGTKTVTLRPEGACFEPGTYYLSVVPRDVSGVCFSFTKSNINTADTTKKEAPAKLLRSGSLNFGEFFQPTIISTKDQLITWKNNRNDWTAWDFVKIGADIDLDGDYWPGVDFSGELDGDGHSITNIQITRDAKWTCFFGTVSGYIHDLKFGSDSDDNSYFRSTNSSGGEGYAAPIGQVNGGRLKNITNYVPVEATGTDVSCIAGICAYYYSSQTADSLVNRATVTVSSDIAASVCHLGGVIGATKGGVDCDFSGCENYGTVSFTRTSSSDLRVGGIIGTLNPAAALSHHLTDCKNNGNCLITNDATISGSALYLGGIVGYSNSPSYPVYLSRCDNNATVANRAGTCSSFIVGGGIAGKLTSLAQVTNCSTSSKALLENTAEGNWIWIGGIAGEAQGATFRGCTNKGSVRNSGNSVFSSSTANADISVGGIVGTISSTGTTLTSCSNEGSVSSSGDVSTSDNPISLGGIAGCDYGGSEFSDCRNSGALSSSSSSTTKRFSSVGGILARNNYRKARLTSCSNEGNISVTGTNSGSSYYDMGGILGLGLDCGTDISSCRANCTINFTGIGNNRHGMAFARILAKGSASCTIQSTGVAGTINGNPLTSSNWNTIYTLYSVAEGNTTVVTEGLNSCYFIQEP